MLIKSDILIIGSGIAGLYCALKLADQFKINLITKREAMEANTRYAQGGIASVMAKTDDFKSHVEDTLMAGAGLCDQNAVEYIISQGPRLVNELVTMGVEFSKMESSEDFDLTREGGHSHRRVLHAGDITGNEIEKALLARIKKHSNIKVYENYAAIDILSNHNISEVSNNCHGAYVLDILSNQVHTFFSQITILATGGAGKVYLYTSNPDIATGDGMAMAYRGGAVMQNLEFVQFHPTCLYNPGGFLKSGRKKSELGRHFLISEALRGEGAKLKLINGDEFMHLYHPQKELAPRDVVARAIDSEMKKRGDDYVLLDISHQEPSWLKNRFPNIYATCLDFGFDLTSEPIPVVPAAHYFCGGIKTDLNGQTSIPYLYAIGEVASTGLHGANRLASNSLLEAVVLADACAEQIKKNFMGIKHEIPFIPNWDPGQASVSDEAVVISQNWDEIRRLMWNYVGIVRSKKRLLRAKRRIDLLLEEIQEYYWNVLITSDLIELRNLACVASLIIESALKRHESRGLHYNIDYPDSLESEKKNTLLCRQH
ncbi:MAG: hypothetical protein ACD_73C00725G0002 [uncultured bacterium]|nr:MAG: hypothetical protein ACD_73C00725G0002 [uncultured bacterium]